MAVKEKTETNEEQAMEAEVEWTTVDNELQLLQILCGTRPIGNKRVLCFFQAIRFRKILCRHQQIFSNGLYS